MMKTVLTIALLIFSGNLFCQQPGEAAKNMAKDAFNLLDRNDSYGGMLILEKMIVKYKHEFDSDMQYAIYKVIRDCCYDVVLARVKNDDANIRHLCLRGIELSKKTYQQYDITDYVLHFYMIAYYFIMENSSKMDVWINKLEYVKRNFTENASLKRELVKWSDENIRTMKSLLSSARSRSFSLGDLFSDNSTADNGSATSYDTNKNGETVKKVTKCCTENILGDKVIIYHAHTNTGEKISLAYYPLLDKWKFKNGWGETNRGEKFYGSMEELVKKIEEE